MAGALGVAVDPVIARREGAAARIDFDPYGEMSRLIAAWLPLATPTPLFFHPRSSPSSASSTTSFIARPVKLGYCGSW
jgi:hypothetical protein